jgi:hypothetical protein
LDGISAAEMILLKKCLGDSDGDPSNNSQNKDVGSSDSLYNWDYGVGYSFPFNYDGKLLRNPHLVKLVDASSFSATRLCDVSNHQFTGVDEIIAPGYCLNKDPPGFYLVLYYDSKDKYFYYLSRTHEDYSYTNEFYVFTTTGFLQLTSSTVEAFTTPYANLSDVQGSSGNDSISLAADLEAFTTASRELKSFYSNVIYTYSTDASGNKNVDCETSTGLLACIKKDDYVMIFDIEKEVQFNWTSNNPKYHNIYQVKKISRENRENTYQGEEFTRYQIVLDIGVNFRFYKNSFVLSHARIFKFTPPSTPVNYVAQCSNRGICDKGSGLCECFDGYTGDDCSVMDALAAF